MDNRYAYHIQLDGIRCLAVFGPLISHFMLGTSMDRIPFGYGVYLFFVLSGFLITSILLKLKEDITLSKSTLVKSYRTFIIRRTLRIFPIYYLIIIFFLLLKSDIVKEYLFWLLTYTLNIKIFIDNAWPSYVTHIWTLAVEEQFYIFIPLLIFITPLKRLPSVFLFIISCALVSKQIFYHLSPERVFSMCVFPLHSFDSLCLGSLLSFFSIYRKEELKKFLTNKTLWFCIHLLFILLLWFFYIKSEIFPVGNFVTSTLLTFIFSILCVFYVGIAGTYGFSGIFGRLLELKPIVYIGKISYGIYLYHNFVPILINVFRIKTGIQIGPSPFLPLLYLAVTIMIASLSWRLIESPINSLKEKFKYHKGE